MLQNSLVIKLKQNQLFKDSFWSLLGNVVGRGLALLAGILVARFLGKDIYGEYGLIRNTILTIGVFSTFGLGYTATKFVAEFKNSQRESIPVFIRYSNKITLVFSGIMALLLFVFADFISRYWLDAVHLGTPLRILSVLIVFNAITTTQIGVLSGFGKFKEIALINSLIGILTFVFSAFLTYYFGLNGALLALLIVQVLNCLFNYYYVKRETVTIDSSTINDKVMLNSIIKFSAPIALQEAIYSITNWSSSIILIKFTTYGELGMYTATMQWNAIILFIPGILRNVALSHLSANSSIKSTHSQILKQTVLINFFATLIPCIVVFILSNLIEQSYGVTFKGMGGMILLAVLSTVFTSASNVYAQAYTSLGRNWLMLLLRTGRDIFILLGFVVFTHSLYYVSGAKALILSNLIFGAMFLLIIVLLYHKLNRYD